MDNSKKQVAISLIQECLDEISYIESDISSAGNWGIYDLLGGKGLSSIIKHGKLRDAQNKLISLQDNLRRLNNMLDNSINHQITAEASTTAKVFDIFFDNMFSDLYIQNHIREIQGQILNLRIELENLLAELSTSFT